MWKHMEKTITLTEGQLTKLVKESVINILNESFFEGRGESKKSKRNAGLAAQARQELGDDKINNAEVARQLEDLGILHGSEDANRSYVSKMKRGERPMPPGAPAGIVNIISGDN